MAVSESSVKQRLEELKKQEQEKAGNLQGVNQHMHRLQQQQGQLNDQVYALRAQVEVLEGLLKPQGDNGKE